MSQQHAARSRAARAAAERAEQQRRERNRRLLLIGSVVLGLLVVVVGAFALQSRRNTVDGDVDRVPSGVSDGYGVVVGDADAPTTLTVYEDFQCPVCRVFENETEGELRAAVDAGRLRIDYRMVSFLDRASTNEYSSRALNAAAVVLDTSGNEAFRRFHALLFDRQPEEGTAGPTDGELVDLAVEAGAVESEVRPGIESKEFADWTANAQAAMSEAGVNSTPTVLVDGEKAGESLEDSVAAALEAAG